MHLNAAHLCSRATQTVSCDPALLTLKYTRPRVEFHSAKANKEESEQRGRSIMTNVVFVCVMGVAFYPRSFVKSDGLREAELSIGFTFETLAKSLRASGDIPRGWSHSAKTKCMNLFFFLLFLSSSPCYRDNCVPAELLFDIVRAPRTPSSEPPGRVKHTVYCILICIPAQ